MSSILAWRAFVTDTINAEQVNYTLHVTPAATTCTHLACALHCGFVLKNEIFYDCLVRALYALRPMAYWRLIIEIPTRLRCESRVSVVLLRFIYFNFYSFTLALMCIIFVQYVRNTKCGICTRMYAYIEVRRCNVVSKYMCFDAMAFCLIFGFICFDVFGICFLLFE